MPLAPVPAAVESQSPAPWATQDHVAEAMPTGNASTNRAPNTFDGPALLNSIFQETACPGINGPVGANNVLTTERSAVGTNGVVTELLLFTGLGS